MAFPDYNSAARENEVLRRFRAGLTPDVLQKCIEHGADTLSDSLQLAQRCERADGAIRFSPLYQQPSLAATATASAPLAKDMQNSIIDLANTVSELKIQLRNLSETVSVMSHQLSSSRSHNPPSSKEGYRSNSPFHRSRRPRSPSPHHHSSSSSSSHSHSPYRSRREQYDNNNSASSANPRSQSPYSRQSSHDLPPSASGPYPRRDSRNRRHTSSGRHSSRSPSSRGGRDHSLGRGVSFAEARGDSHPGNWA